MFDKLISRDPQENIAQEEARQKVALAVEDASQQQRESFGARFTEGVMNKTGQALNNVKEGFGERALSFTRSSVKLVQVVDKDLEANHSVYEVGSFRVAATAGINTGMTLDIQFIKTKNARSDTSETLKYFIVNSPATGKPIKIPKANLEGRTQAKIKDPDTGDVLLIDARTGKLLPQPQQD